MSLLANTYFLLASSQLFPFSERVKRFEEHPSEALEMARRGYSLVKEGKMSEAFTVYNEAIEKFPEQPFFYACKAILFMRLEDEESAFYNYQSAKRLDFNYHHYLEWLENKGQMEEAVELLELNDIQPEEEEAQLLLNRAMLQVQHFNYEEAIADFTEAFDKTKRLDILVSRAAISMQLLRYDEALDDLNAVLQGQRSVEAYLYRAKLYAFVRENSSALQDFEQAVQLAPTDARIYEERASLYEQLKEYDKAANDYSQIITLKEDDFYAYVLRADVYEKLENWEAAIADYSEAIKLNPYYSDLYQYRGELRARVGDSAGAEEDFRKFEELEDEDED